MSDELLFPPLSGPQEEYGGPLPDDVTFDTTVERLQRSIKAGYLPAIAEAIDFYTGHGLSLPAGIADKASEMARRFAMGEGDRRGRGRKGNPGSVYLEARKEYWRWRDMKQILIQEHILEEIPHIALIKAAEEVREISVMSKDSKRNRDELKHHTVTSDILVRNFREIERRIKAGDADLNFAAAELPLILWWDGRGQIPRI